MLIVGGSGNNRGAILGAVLVWGIWAGSAGAMANLFPPGEQARAAALQIVMIGVALCAILLLAPARHSGRGARGLAPSRTVVRRAAAASARNHPRGGRPVPATPDRIVAWQKSLSISRLVCGLWQVADLEKGGTLLDPEQGADALASLCAAPASTRSTWPTTTAAPS